MKNNAFTPLQTKCGSDTFIIKPYGDDAFLLAVDPAWRYNGTQNYDGYFPREYKTPQAAKAALSRFLMKKTIWTPINS
tara:strand:- start:10 stop:243 length:234 start_codon:yes stop_codon:yes gene_type:complete